VSTRRPMRTLQGRVLGPSPSSPSSAPSPVCPGLGWVFRAPAKGRAPPPALNAALRQKRHEEIGLCWAPGLAVRGGSLAVLDLTVQNGFLPAQEIHGSPR
jgi:hypothetical protein